MIIFVEFSANLLNTLGIFLAGRNSRHTWWVGTSACILFAGLFSQRHLYENAAQQIFFIATNVVGWWNWSSRKVQGKALPIRRSSMQYLVVLGMIAALATIGYEIGLSKFVTETRPFTYMLVLGFSILAQFLLMGRRIETWPCWIFVNGMCVPLFILDGMKITAALCAVYFFNSVYAAFKWKKIMAAEVNVLQPTI